MIPPLLAEAAVSVAATLLLALGSLAAKRLADWLKLSADDQVRTYLQQALDLATSAVEQQLRARLTASGFATALPPGGRQAAVLEGAGYVAGRVPDALRRFGLSEADLAEMIERRLAARGA